MAVQEHGVEPSSSGSDDAAALRALLQSFIPPRKREDVTGGDDIFSKLGLSRYRDAALNLQGRGLYSKLQTAVVPLLYDPPGCALAPARLTTWDTFVVWHAARARAHASACAIV
jgi:hypothetical protein